MRFWDVCCYSASAVAQERSQPLVPRDKKSGCRWRQHRFQEELLVFDVDTAKLLHRCQHVQSSGRDTVHEDVWPSELCTVKEECER